MDEPTPFKMTTTPEVPKLFKEWYADLDVNQISEIITGGEYTERMAEAYAKYLGTFWMGKLWTYNEGRNDGYFKGISDANGAELAAEFKRLKEENELLKQQLKTTEK